MSILNLISFLSLPLTTFAFDPVTAMATAQGAQSMLAQIDEASELGFSLVDLLNEVGVESEMDQVLQSKLDQMYQLNSKAQELSWTSDDLNRSLSQDLSQGQNLTVKVKALRNTIATSKKLATLLGFRPKAAQKAIQIQQIKLDTMMLEELQALRRAQYLAYLEDREAKHQRDLFLEEIVQTERAKLRRTR